MKSTIFVSIPFKRESGFKLPNTSLKGERKNEKFQFPSNGKVDSNMVNRSWSYPTDLFQFPSNGKVDSNLSIAIEGVNLMKCFNSLQTGKWIQTPA